jgi:hypothetical protein
MLNPGQSCSDQKNLVKGGNVPTTLFLGFQMGKKAKIYERMIDTTTELERNAFQICVSWQNPTSLVMFRWRQSKNQNYAPSGWWQQYMEQYDYNSSQLPNSTARCEVIDTSNYHESCISRFLLLCGLVGCKALQGQLRCLQRPWKPQKPSTAPDSIWSPVYTEE